LGLIIGLRMAYALTTLPFRRQKRLTKATRPDSLLFLFGGRIGCSSNTTKAIVAETPLVGNGLRNRREFEAPTMVVWAADHWGFACGAISFHHCLREAPHQFVELIID
jgi:hypothetical protein